LCVINCICVLAELGVILENKMHEIGVDAKVD
jgi:hypothetical protein